VSADLRRKLHAAHFFGFNGFPNFYAHDGEIDRFTGPWYNASLMPQIYFFSILCNALSGFVLLTDGLEDDGDGGGFFKNQTFRLCLGAITALTGLLKLLSVMPGNYPIVGDIVPALGGLTAGAALLYEFYKAHATTGGLDAGLSLFFNTHKKAVGIAVIVSALLHFFFPTALFL
jgi:hypothetical protein